MLDPLAPTSGIVPRIDDLAKEDLPGTVAAVLNDDGEPVVGVAWALLA